MLCSVYSSLPESVALEALDTPEHTNDARFSDPCVSSNACHWAFAGEVLPEHASWFSDISMQDPVMARSYPNHHVSSQIRYFMGVTCQVSFEYRDRRPMALPWLRGCQLEALRVGCYPRRVRRIWRQHGRCQAFRRTSACVFVVSGLETSPDRCPCGQTNSIDLRDLYINV